MSDATRRPRTGFRRNEWGKAMPRIDMEDEGHSGFLRG